MDNYGTLVQQIELEAQAFREENLKLRDDLATLIEENNRLRSDDKNDPLGVFKNSYVKVADAIFNNLRHQIHQISQVWRAFKFNSLS